MTTSMSNIEDFLAHRRLALVGASHDPRDFSRAVMRSLMAKGYDVVPVNRRAATPEGRAELIEGRPVYARVEEIPAPVDGALLMVPAEASRDVVSDCLRAGVARIWFHRGAGPGSSSPEALGLARAEGLIVIDGECPLMHLGLGGAHAAHGALRRLSGHFPSDGVVRPAGWVFALLTIVQGLLGVNALGAGTSLLVDPSGALLGMSPALLGPSPFASFLVPGLTLVVGIGLTHVAAAILSARHHKKTALVAVLCGLALIGWIAAQWLWLSTTSFLQPLVLALGLLEVGLGFYLVRRAPRAARPIFRTRQGAT